MRAIPGPANPPDKEAPDTTPPCIADVTVLVTDFFASDCGSDIRFDQEPRLTKYLLVYPAAVLIRPAGGQKRPFSPQSEGCPNATV